MGPIGPAGISAYEVLSREGPLLTDQDQGLSVFCSLGKRVLGGGVSIFSSVANTPMPVIVTTLPNLSATGWEGKAFRPGTATTWRITVTAICANVAP